MLDRLDDTIVAISSPPGFGLLGIVRLSGKTALSIASQMVRLENGRKLSRVPASSRRTAEIVLDADRTLPAEVYVFRAPQSYTRQDLVEMHTIGSPAVLEAVRQRAVQLGALQAQPGEFTARAFLGGAMDLASAEAVAGVISAKTDTQLRAARSMMDGALHRRIEHQRDQLAELLALVEADIDFSEEPIEFITPTQLNDRLGKIGDDLNDLAQGDKSKERHDTLPRILLLGQPNAGKSTLMNRLCGTERAIAAQVPGTTRDVLTASIKLGRGQAILMDAAGIDDAGDALAAQAQAMTLSQTTQVDLICVVLDGPFLVGDARGAISEAVLSLAPGQRVVAINKCDLLSPGEQRSAVERVEHAGLGSPCLISALSGDGLEELRASLAGALTASETTASSQSILINERQRDAIAAAAETIGRATSICVESAETIDCADLLAFELREALDQLGAVTGAVTTEDLLAKVFSRFCIGK